MTHRFSAALLAALTAGTLHAGENEKSPIDLQPLADYQALWTRSLFTTHEVKPVAPAVMNADWAVNLQLSGWSEVDGRLYVYLYRTDTTQTFILKQNEPAEAGVMQLVEAENTETILDARVRVHLNGQEAWISQQKESEAPQAAPQPPAQAVAALQAPTSVDSRAGLLREGVVFKPGTTFENSLNQPVQQVAAAGATRTMSASDESTSNAAVLMRLRERHEHLHRMFPRQGGP